MTLILRGRRWGFSLEEIRQWLEIYEKEGTEPQYREFLRLADRQLEALAKERTEPAPPRLGGVTTSSGHGPR